VLQILQNEWDALMLETYTLKQHLHTIRQELAHALYQHDAACRVIARLIKERDAARAALVDTGGNVASIKKGPPAVGATSAPLPVAPSKEGEAGAETGITSEVIEVMNGAAKQLSKGRKKRVRALVSAAAQRSNVKRYNLLSSHPLHSASKPGIFALDIHPTDNDLIVTGGADSNAIVFNRKTGKIVDTLEGHKKRLTDVKFHPSEKVIFTTSQDNTALIHVANSNGNYEVKHTLKGHTDEVIGCTLHPSGNFLVTASKDRTWAFHDVNTGTLRQKVSDSKIEGGFTRISFHPDGLILGGGTSDTLVRIFDVKEQKNVANFRGHAGAVTGLSFSENGYYLASADDQGTVKLWDLRKLQNFHTISSKDLTTISNISFDDCGAWLGIAGEDIRVYSSKGWELVKTFKEHKATVTAVRFGPNANFIASTSKDRNLKFFGGK
jgi:pre-mRNA-processing factor 19